MTEANGSAASRSPETNQRLAPFVPKLALDLAETPGDVHQLVEGSMLSADISGFTALSERLARKGREGAEELTGLINACFTGLIETAGHLGGEVIKFGGDALLVMFQGDGHERRSAQAAQSMQIVLKALGVARRASLSMTVGVAPGPFNVFLVGSRSRELLVCGPAASEVIRLEAAAGQGQVLASVGLSEAMLGTSLDGGIVIWDNTEMPHKKLPKGVDLSPFLPAAVVDQLSAFSDTGGEHRLVTVGFVSLSGISSALDDQGPKRTAIELGLVVDLINNASQSFNVTPLHSDIGPDGVKFVLCAGAPLSAGNSSDALLQTALRISEAESPFVLKQGVQRGRVFAGFLGSTRRRNYTLMGDPVNTAARMLGKAEDREIIAVADVVRDTRSIFVAEELEPFLVKGKADPISAFRVHAITGEVRRSGEYAELVGRKRELKVIAEAVEERGRFVHMVGDGGSGKSRLIDIARDAVDFGGYGRFQSTCSPYGSSSPYALFRGLLRSGFGMDIHTDAETTGDLLSKVVHQYARELEPWIPLLAIPFGAKVESTPEVDALGAEFRRTRTHEVVTEFLDTAFDLPIALIAEDVHWADDASLELLEYLARETNARGWVTFTTQRPGAATFGADVDDLTLLEVGALDSEALKALAIDVSEDPLSDQQLRLITERSGGNPLFAIELTRAVNRGGAVELPDSVEKLISSRLDELSPDARRLLRIASVFGTEMKERDLMTVLADEAPDLVPPWDEVGEFLSRLSDGSISFQNIVSHDAAYQGLPFRARRRLHGKVAEHIEGSSEHPERVAALLCTHFSEARQHGKCWTYGLLAGEAALASASTAEAATSLLRALESSRYVADLEKSEIAGAAAELAETQLNMGHGDEARRWLQYARKQNSDAVTEISLMRRLGRVEERENNSKDALRWWSRAEAKLPTETSEVSFVLERAMIGLERSAVLHRRGENDVVLESAERAYADATASGDGAIAALALERINLAKTYLPDEDPTEAGLAAVEAYNTLGDHTSKSRVLNNLGIGAYFAGDWTTASTRYGEAMEAGLTAGSAVDGSLGGLNQGEILSDQGHWQEAVNIITGVLRNFSAARYGMGVAVAHLYLGIAERRLQNWNAAIDHLREALATFAEGNVAAYMAEAQTRLMEVDVYRGKVDREAIATRLDQMADDDGLRPRMLRISSLAYHLAADHERALTDMEQAADGTSGLDRAIALSGLVHVAPDDKRVAKWETEASTIMDDLGVEKIAAFPG